MRIKTGLILIVLTAATWALGSFAPGASAQELVEAVKAGDLDKVKALVENDPRIVDLPNAAGETILFAAVAGLQPALIEYFIAKGADVNHENDFHMAPLHIACRRGVPLEIIRILVEKGADVNAVSKYQGRPLDMAAENGDEAVVGYLASKGAGYTPIDFETVRLSDSLHRLAFPWGMRNNLIVFHGSDGLLVVDTGFNKRAIDGFKKIVAGFAKGEFKYVINTHSHWDHSAGNALLAPSEAAVIGAKKLGGGNMKSILVKSERTPVGRAGRTLPSPYVMKFNGEDIELIPYPGLHSGEDLMIHFPKSKVLCLGDLLLSQSCPAVGDAAGYLDLLDKVLDVFPAGTTFVSGHGRDLNSSELKKYREDMAAMAEIVKKEYAAGKTVEDMIGADLLKAYKPAYSHLDWLGPDSWIRTVVQGLSSGR